MSRCNCKPLIFIDTCSLLDSCWIVSGKNVVYSQEKDDRFWRTEFSSLISVGEVIIPKRNYDELIKHSKRHGNGDLAQRSNHVLNRIRHLYEKGYLLIVGDANDPFADAIILSAALKFTTQRDLAFITQDRALAEDLEAIRQFRSLTDHSGFPKHDIKIRRIAKSGELKPFKGLQKSLLKRFQSPPSRPDQQKANENKPMQEITQTQKNWWDD